MTTHEEQNCIPDATEEEVEYDGICAIPPVWALVVSALCGIPFAIGLYFFWSGEKSGIAVFFIFVGMHCGYCMVFFAVIALRFRIRNCSRRVFDVINKLVLRRPPNR